MKVFLDTNVWLSATVFPGLCKAILTECHRCDWLLTSPLLQVEAHDVLVRKFPQLPHSLSWFDAIWAQARCVPDLAEPADDNDVRLVRTASMAGAGVLVTGDQRVLTWGRDGDMQILSPRDAWTLLFAGKTSA